MLTAEQERHLYAYYGEASANGIHIEFNYKFNTDRINAGAFIHATHRGDTSLELLADTLRQVANEYHLPVVHTGSPLTALAEKMFRRNTDYEEFIQDGHVFFRREFQPATA
jgi:hypothetical protein